jgi:uncharacterized protein (TIGR03437 family)
MLGRCFLLLAMILSSFLTGAMQAQPQIGGGVCANSTLNGTYYYLLSGDVLSGNQIDPYVELGKLVADGQGRLSGNSHASIGGNISAYTLAGTYSVQSTCTGSMSLSVNSQPPSSVTFQVVSGGLGAIIAFSGPTGVVAGRAYRQTSSAGSIQCAAPSLSGSYAYLLTGAFGNGFYYSQVGNATGDGRGGMTETGMANVSGTTLSSTGQGSYSVASDCTGTASIRDQNGTSAYYVAVAGDGQELLFMRSDPGYTVGGLAQPSFTAPQSAVVNAASFDPKALSPGAIFSIFGQNFPQSTSAAQVLVNGEAAPVFFSNGTQLNAQVPYDVPTDRPVTLSVTSAGASSNAVLLSAQPAAPGIFTYGANRAVVENPDFSVNSASNPAHAGDIVTVYLTGGGSVNPAVPTGAPAPTATLSTATADNSFTIGGIQAVVSYFGLAPGFAGLYQANVKIPALSPGDYQVAATVAGVTGNAPLISVR